MKRILVVIIAVCMLLTCSACSNSGEQSEPGNGDARENTGSEGAGNAENAENHENRAAENGAEGFFVKVESAGAPIAGAVVSLLDLTSLTEWRGEADSDGIVLPEAKPDSVYRLRVEMAGYISRSLYLDDTMLEQGQMTVALLPEKKERWYLAVECVIPTAGQGAADAANSDTVNSDTANSDAANSDTASDDPEGIIRKRIAENKVLLLQSDDARHWSPVPDAPEITGNSPDLEWSGEDLLMVLGNTPVTNGQYGVRVMKHDGSAGKWLGPDVATTCSEGIQDYSMGVFDYGLQNGESALFKTSDGRTARVGQGFPDTLFLDLGDDVPEKKYYKYDFVCGFADLYEGFGGSVFYDRRTRNRVAVLETALLEQPDVLTTSSGTWIFVSNQSEVFALPVSDASDSNPDTLWELPPAVSSGSFSGVSPACDEKAEHAFLAFGDASDGSIGIIELVNPDMRFDPNEAVARITPEALGLPAGSKLINPGLCAAGTGAKEPESPEVLTWSDYEQYTYSAYATDSDEETRTGGFRASLTDGVLELLKLQIYPRTAYVLGYRDIAAEDFVLQSYAEPAMLDSIGFSFNMRLYGFKQSMMTLLIHDKSWSLEEMNYNGLVQYHGARVGAYAPKHKVLAEGTCETPMNAGLATMWAEDGILRVFSDSNLIVEIDVSEYGMNGGDIAFCFASGDEALEQYPCAGAKSIRLK